MDGRFGKARIAILTILPEEFTAAQRAFDARARVPGTHGYARQVPSQKGAYPVVVFRATDVGTGDAQKSTDKIIEHLRPDFLILAGIAGGVKGRDDVALGDAVVPILLYYGERMKIAEGRALRRDGPVDQPSEFLRQLIDDISVDDKWHDLMVTPKPIQRRTGRQHGPQRGNTPELRPKILRAPLLTTEKVLGDEDNVIQKEILKFYDNVVAVDMESIGFARAVFYSRFHPEYNPQLAVVRGISDFVQTKRNKSQRRKWIAYASDVAACLSHELAERVLSQWPV